jgi:two-component system cell cycle response regulator DivK
MATRSTVLYVEDNFDNRILIRRVLMAEGYAVVEAENAQQALDYLRAETPDLILMDINMPGVDGFMLTSEIKGQPQLAGVPIIAVTANVMKGDRERTLAAGCDGYIQKPIDVDDLPNQISQYLPRAS